MLLRKFSLFFNFNFFFFKVTFFCDYIVPIEITILKKKKGIRRGERKKKKKKKKKKKLKIELTLL